MVYYNLVVSITTSNQQPNGKSRCQFAQKAERVPQCDKQSTTKWGGFWFCAEHGERNPKADPVPLTDGKAEIPKSMHRIGDRVIVRDWGSLGDPTNHDIL